MPNYLKMPKQSQVLALLELGWSYRRIEAETGVRDAQRIVRRIRERDTDGGMDEILLVLADTRGNRAALTELLEALGPRFETPAGPLLAALRNGTALPGSGVLLI